MWVCRVLTSTHCQVLRSRLIGMWLFAQNLPPPDRLCPHGRFYCVRHQDCSLAPMPVNMKQGLFEASRAPVINRKLRFRTDNVNVTPLNAVCTPIGPNLAKDLLIRRGKQGSERDSIAEGVISKIWELRIFHLLSRFQFILNLCDS